MEAAGGALTGRTFTVVVASAVFPDGSSTRSSKDRVTGALVAGAAKRACAVEASWRSTAGPDR
jgi:hypothetical protein